MINKDLYAVFEKGHHVNSLAIFPTLKEAQQKAKEWFLNSMSYIEKEAAYNLEEECRGSQGYDGYSDSESIRIYPLNYGETESDI